MWNLQRSYKKFRFLKTKPPKTDCKIWRQGFKQLVWSEASSWPIFKRFQIPKQWILKIERIKDHGDIVLPGGGEHSQSISRAHWEKAEKKEQSWHFLTLTAVHFNWKCKGTEAPAVFNWWSHSMLPNTFALQLFVIHLFSVCYQSLSVVVLSLSAKSIGDTLVCSDCKPWLYDIGKTLFEQIYKTNK